MLGLGRFLSPGARSTRARASCFGTPSLERGLLHDREQHAAHSCTSLGPCAVCQAGPSPVDFVLRRARRPAASHAIPSPCWTPWYAAKRRCNGNLAKCKAGFVVPSPVLPPATWRGRCEHTGQARVGGSAAASAGRVIAATLNRGTSKITSTPIQSKPAHVRPWCHHGDSLPDPVQGLLQHDFET